VYHQWLLPMGDDPCSFGPLPTSGRSPPRTLNVAELMFATFADRIPVRVHETPHLVAQSELCARVWRGQYPPDFLVVERVGSGLQIFRWSMVWVGPSQEFFRTEPAEHSNRGKVGARDCGAQPVLAAMQAR